MERLKQVVIYVIVGSLLLFLAIKLLQDPVGAAHVVGNIVLWIGKAFGAIWTFLSTLWAQLGG